MTQRGGQLIRAVVHKSPTLRQVHSVVECAIDTNIKGALTHMSIVATPEPQHHLVSSARSQPQEIT